MSISKYISVFFGSSIGYLGLCAGFGYCSVHFHHSSLYGISSWVCAESSVESTGMLQLLLSSACTVRAFLLLAPPSQWVVSRLQLHKQFGGDTTRTADLIWSRGYFLFIFLSEHMAWWSVYKEGWRRRKGGIGVSVCS